MESSQNLSLPSIKENINEENKNKINILKNKIEEKEDELNKKIKESIYFLIMIDKIANTIIKWKKLDK